MIWRAVPGRLDSRRFPEASDPEEQGLADMSQRQTAHPPRLTQFSYQSTLSSDRARSVLRYSHHRPQLKFSVLQS